MSGEQLVNGLLASYWGSEAGKKMARGESATGSIFMAGLHASAILSASQREQAAVQREQAAVTSAHFDAVQQQIGEVQAQQDQLERRQEIEATNRRLVSTMLLGIVEIQSKLEEYDEFCAATNEKERHATLIRLYAITQMKTGISALAESGNMESLTAIKRAGIKLRGLIRECGISVEDIESHIRSLNTAITTYNTAIIDLVGLYEMGGYKGSTPVEQSRNENEAVIVMQQICRHGGYPSTTIGDSRPSISKENLLAWRAKMETSISSLAQATSALSKLLRYANQAGWMVSASHPRDKIHLLFPQKKEYRYCDEICLLSCSIDCDFSSKDEFSLVSAFMNSDSPKRLLKETKDNYKKAIREIHEAHDNQVNYLENKIRKSLLRSIDMSAISKLGKKYIFSDLPLFESNNLSAYNKSVSAIRIWMLVMIIPALLTFLLMIVVAMNRSFDALLVFGGVSSFFLPGWIALYTRLRELKSLRKSNQGVIEGGSWGKAA